MMMKWCEVVGYSLATQLNALNVSDSWLNHCGFFFFVSLFFWGSLGKGQDSFRELYFAVHHLEVATTEYADFNLTPVVLYWLMQLPK